MLDNHWLVVETLDEALSPTVIADGGNRKNWSNPRRARPEFGPIAASTVDDVVKRCRSSRRPTIVRVLDRRGPKSVVAHGRPVFGPSNAVHAVQVWVGREDVEPPPPRIVCGWVWDARAELNHQGPGLEESFHGIPPEAVQTSRTAPENFRHIVRFDDRIGYVALVVDIVGGGQWQGDVTFLGADGVKRQAQMVTRAIAKDHRVHGLNHDITDVSPPEPKVDDTTLRIVAQAVGGVGLMVLNEVLVYDWIAPPPPPLDRWVWERPTYSAGHHEALSEVCARLVQGLDTATLSLRMKFSDTDWITATATLTVIERTLAPQALIQVSFEGTDGARDS